MKVKLAFFVALIFIAASFLGCNKPDNKEAEYSVAILMHCSSTGNKHIDADAMANILIDSGYNTQILYADKDISLQNNQIQDLIGNIDVIIITPVSTKGLSSSLEEASDNGIKIISYDKLILDTEAVDYYAAYSHTLIGMQQALSLVEGLHSHGEPPYNIEIFAGTSNEESVYKYYAGAMSVLQPLIDSGEIIVTSNQSSYAKIHDKGYLVYNPKQRLQTLLDIYYDSKVQLHGILCPNDKMALDFIKVLNDNEDRYNDYPIITGQNANLKNVHLIINGHQYSTVFKNPYVLAQVAANMTIAMLNGTAPDINDSTSFDNGAKVVQAYLCEPMLVTRENYQTVLIDSGYYEYIEVFPEY